MPGTEWMETFGTSELEEMVQRAWETVDPALAFIGQAEAVLEQRRLDAYRRMQRDLFAGEDEDLGLRPIDPSRLLPAPVL